MYLHLYMSYGIKREVRTLDTVDPRLSKPWHLAESSFIPTHKFGGEYHYLFVNRYEYH